MNVLFFIPATAAATHWLEQVLDSLPEDVSVEICRNVATLSRRLRQPSWESSIAVLAVTDKPQLCQLLDLSALLKDLPLILIIPDADRQTLSLGHKLYPRFLATRDGDTDELATILTKMLSQHRQREVSAA